MSNTQAQKLSLWVLNSKGGVGKTTLALAMADLFLLNEKEPTILEIDSRKRLSTFIPEVLSFTGSPPIETLRLQPNALLEHYDPLSEALMQPRTLLDIGANEDGPFLEYAKLSRLDEDFQEEDIRVLTLIPCVTESESVRGALEALDVVKKSLPNAQRVLVLNERDGQNWDLYITQKMREDLQKDGVLIRVFPKIVAEGWEEFQRGHMRFSEIITLSPEDIGLKFGFVRSKSKRSRGDMAYWFKCIDDTFSPLMFPEIQQDDEEETI